MFEDRVKYLLEVVEREINFNEVSYTDKEILQELKRELGFLNGKAVGHLSKRTIDELDIDVLSGKQGALVMLRFNLGDMVSAAKASFLAEEKALELKKYKYRDKIEADFLDKKIKVTQRKIDGEVAKQTFTKELRVIKKEERYDRLKNLYYDLKELVESMKLRIYVLMSLKSQGKYLDNSVPLPPDIEINT